MGYNVSSKLELKLDEFKALIERKKYRLETARNYPKKKLKFSTSKNSLHKHP